MATQKDLDDAVEAGNLAFKTWQKTTVEERRKRIKEFADAFAAQKDEWAELIAQEAGQSVRPLEP